MKRKKTLIIFDEKSELMAVSGMRRKPGTVFVIAPFDYLGGTEKWFDLVAESIVKDTAARRRLPKGGQVA